MSDRSREREAHENRRTTTGPFGTMLRWSFGPFGAAVGSAVDANRAAFTFAFGTGISDDGGDGSDGDGAPVEIEEPGADDGEPVEDEPGDDGATDVETDER